MYPEADFRKPLRAPFRSTFFDGAGGGLGVVGVAGVGGGGGGGGGALPVLEVLLLVVVAVSCRKLIRTLSWISGGPRCVFIMVDERLV